MNKGVFIAVNLDEFTLDQGNGQQKPKAKIKVSYPGRYVRGQNGQQGRSEYCHCTCSTQQQYQIEQIMQLGLPMGKMPFGQGAPKIYLTIPYEKLNWSLFTTNDGKTLITAGCDIDGDISFATPPPKRPSKYDNQNQGQQPPFQQNQGQQQPQWQNQGQQMQQPQQQWQQQQSQQPQWQQQQPQGAPPQQWQQPMQPMQQQQQFPAATPPGFGGAQQPQFQQPQTQAPQYQQPQGQPQFQQPTMGGSQPAAPFPSGQPQFGAPPAANQFAGTDPYTA